MHLLLGPLPRRGVPGVTVIGMGNPDMGDDGIGVRVAELVREEARRGAWRNAPQVVSAGTDAVLAGACCAEDTDVLLVDAVNMEAEAGEWRVFPAREALPCPAGRARLHPYPAALRGDRDGARPGVCRPASHPGRPGGRRAPGAVPLAPRGALCAGYSHEDQGGG